MDKDIEGSLKDVKLMIEGVSGILNKINIKSSKNSYSNRKINTIDETIPKLINSEKKINIEKQDNKSNLLEEIDKEIMELIKEEEKKQKLKNEKEKENKKDNLENYNNNNNKGNDGNNINEIKSNEKEYRSSRFKEKINGKDNNKINEKDETVKFK